MLEFTNLKARCIMIKVVKQGLYSSIQDRGRSGYQNFGVPYAGAMDTYAFAVANMLLGNEAHAAVLEMTMTGPTLLFEEGTIISISGANMSPVLNGVPIENNKAVDVPKNALLTFGTLKSGFRAYLAVADGFKTGISLKSRSMFKGITEQYIIKQGDLLPTEYHRRVFLDKHASIRFNGAYLKSEVIEAFKGPEFDKLSKKEQQCLMAQDYSISKDYNRMACQLQEPLENNLEPIITSLVLPGTVQLTPSGKLIVLMRDCQTTGGYPRILQLKESAMNIMAQKFTGNKIRFKLVNKP